MADISKIKLPSGDTYDIKDAVARAAQVGGMHFVGVTTTALTDGSAAETIMISGASHTSTAGDIVLYNSKEFVFSDVDSKWHEFGDNSAFKALAYKDSASATYTPAGGVSQPTFTGTEGNVSVSGTPEGTISVAASDTGNYTPAGSVAAPAISVKTAGTTTTVNSITDVGTLPSLTTTVENELLTISFSQGTLPTKGANTTVKTGDAAYQATAPSFTGTKVQLDFTGTATSSTGKFTPAGTVSKPTFTGTQATITAS
jgi:hypothetical protein